MVIEDPLPLSEGSGINDNNGVLDQGLGSDQLMVGGVVDHVDDPGLARDGLAAPGEVSLIEPQGSVFLVSSTNTKGVDSLGSQLGHGSRSGQLELPLLADGSSLASGGATLMPVISRDTHPVFCKNVKILEKLISADEI